MKQFLTIDEINSRYRGEWVLLEDPKVDEHDRVIGGTVICHSKDRDEVDRKAIELRPENSAFLYTGKMPPNAAIVL